MAGGFAAGACARAATRVTDSPAPDGFNGFMAALCDAFAEAVPGCLPAPLADFLADFLAAALRFFTDGFFADVLADFSALFPDLARVAFPGEVLGDFLRVFLDIRLPFVAFGGSIIKMCGGYPGMRESVLPLGKSDDPGVRLQGIRRNSVLSLNVLLGPDDE